MIVVDTNELRSAAAALGRAAQSVMDVCCSLPRQVPAAPAIAAPAAEALAQARRDMDELVAEVRQLSDRLTARATEVDDAEQRWWQIGAQPCCGCVLPSGEVVTYASPSPATAMSSAAGPGTADVTVGSSANVQVVSITPSTGGLFDSVTPATLPAGSAPGPTMTVESGDSLFPPYTVVTNSALGLQSPYDAQADAGADSMTARILSSVGATGAGLSSTPIGGQTLIGALDSGPTALVGSGTGIYTTAMGNLVVDTPDGSAHANSQTALDA